MLLTELFDDDGEIIDESAKIAWARVGNKVVRKYRCTTGKRQGRIVSSPADCSKPLDLKKHHKMKMTRKAKGSRMAAKRKRTLARNPASVRVQRLNKNEKVGSTQKD